jgi:hypothetical protein
VTRALVVLLLAACSKSGEHASMVGICKGSMPGKTLADATVDRIDRDLRARLVADGFTACTWTQTYEYQQGATPIAWYCGSLGDTPVHATINRPGFAGAKLELDLRAEVSGSESSIHDQELPVVRYRNTTAVWFEDQIREHQARTSLGCDVYAHGAWLTHHASEWR